MELTQQEKTRRLIGICLLCIGSLGILWGDYNNNLAIIKFGKTSAAFGIVIYFLGRIAKLLRKNK